METENRAAAEASAPGPGSGGAREGDRAANLSYPSTPLSPAEWSAVGAALGMDTSLSTLKEVGIALGLDPWVATERDLYRAARARIYGPPIHLDVHIPAKPEGQPEADVTVTASSAPSGEGMARMYAIAEELDRYWIPAPVPVRTMLTRAREGVEPPATRALRRVCPNTGTPVPSWLPRCTCCGIRAEPTWSNA